MKNEEPAVDVDGIRSCRQKQPTQLHSYNAQDVQNQRERSVTTFNAADDMF